MMADGCLVVTSFAEVFVIIFLLVGGLEHFFHILEIFFRGVLIPPASQKCMGRYD
jgi:hypothetical protein